MVTLHPPSAPKLCGEGKANQHHNSDWSASCREEIGCWMVPKCIHSLTEVLLILTWHLPPISSAQKLERSVMQQVLPLLQPTKKLRKEQWDEPQEEPCHFELIIQSVLFKGAIPPTSSLGNNWFFLNDYIAQLRERFFENKHITSKTCILHVTNNTTLSWCRHLRNAAHISGIPSWTLKSRFTEPQFKLQQP